MTKEKFLETLYAGLDGNIEVREITKEKKTKKRYFFSSINELKNYNPPSNVNVYIGIYTRVGRNGTAAGCLSTKVLWADFDYKSAKEVKEIIRQANIPAASTLVSSGYGIHAYWVLKERTKDDIAVQLIKAIQKRTGADPKAAEKARILRLPGSFNIKHDEVVQCKIVEANETQFNIDELKEILKDDILIIAKKTEVIKDIPELKNCSKACIRFMAKGTSEGHRNFALCKITKWLQLRGYTRRASLDVIRRWNTLNNPPKADNQVILEFNKTWDTDYKMLGCKFKNKALQEQNEYFCGMGECRYATTQVIEEIASDTTCRIDNKIFNEDIYTKIRGLDLAIYFTIAKAEGITRNHLCKLIGVHKQNKNLIRAVDYLRELNLISVIEGNKRNREKDLLILGSEYNDGRGYTLINKLLSETYLGKRITDTEYKLLSLLKFHSYSSDEIFVTRRILAKEMGTSEKTITRTLSSLKYKLYIKIDYKELENGKTKFSIKLEI